MKFTVLTLFPGMIEGFLSESIIKRASEKNILSVNLVDLRLWGIGKWKKVDDTPYGGGAGMVLRVDVVAKAIQDIKSESETRNSKLRTVLLTPQGKKYNQAVAKELAADNKDLLLICGHYEGFDERIRDYVDEEISIGDYVLTGGELAAAVVIDSVARLISGVLGKAESHQEESFSIPVETRNSELETQNYLEYPHYTKPKLYEGKQVPEILRSGNHQKISEWRAREAIKRTKDKRPDLLE
jgi:tRNA (guanine37-N1)-methyltransferase